MRRGAFILLAVALVAGVLFVVVRYLGMQKVRGVAQNVIAGARPQSVIERPPVLPSRDEKPGQFVAPPVASSMKKEDSPSLPPPMTPPAVNRLHYPAPPPPDEWAKLSAEQRLHDARRRLQPQLDAELSARGFKLGDAAFIRIFKETSELELWLRHDAAGKPFRLYCNYRIAFYSGTLGPKTKEGDYQAPEGFYSVGKSQLNPASRYHLAFNVGYPNEYDRAQKRTGSLIMVHGSDVSIGCFAMTDPLIEEIYLIVEAALDAGQRSVPVHVFPFRMTGERMAGARMSNDEWLGFWENLKTGHDLFESQKLPPAVSVESGAYTFRL